MQLNTDNSTLREGLEKFYITYTENLSHTDECLPKDVKEFFRSHDIAHVLFGCDISVFGEGSVKLWTIFGTTLGFWNHFSEYKKAKAYELSKQFSMVNFFQNLLRLLMVISTLIYRANQMNKKWPWRDFDGYLDTSISEIRKEFNIKVLG